MVGAGQGAERAKSGGRVSGRSSCRPARSLLPPSVPCPSPRAPAAARLGLVRPVWATPPGSLLGGTAASQSIRPSLGTPAQPGFGAERPQGWGASGNITTGSTVGSSPRAPGHGHGGWVGAAEVPISSCSPLHVTCQHPSPKGPAPEFPSYGVPPWTFPSPRGSHSSPLHRGRPPAPTATTLTPALA